MSRVSWMIASTVVALLFAGCGGSPDAASTSEQSQASADTNAGGPAALAAGPGTPARVVGQFYEALRDGDDGAISRLLTDKARGETAKNDLEIRSLGNPSLSFKIGETEYVTEEKDGAHVASVWTETDEDERSESIEVIWVVRKQADGWRIAGFAQVFEGDMPVVFNFEDPEHMLRTKEYVETELYGQEDQPVMQATNPAAPTTPDTQLR